MIKTKRAQMKIQQMAFMMIAVTLFFVMAGMFILVIRFSGLKDTAELLEERNALLLVSKIANSPEFGCGNAFGGPRSNCIDTDKVMALKGRLQDYSGFWGVSGIEIRKIAGISGAGIEIECTLENYPACEEITLVPPKEGTGVSDFVALCRKERIERIIYSCELIEEGNETREECRVERIINQVIDICEFARIIVTYDFK